MSSTAIIRSICSRSPLASRQISIAGSSSRIVLNQRAIHTSKTRWESQPAASVSGMDEGERSIYDKLKTSFPGQRLEVQDVSGGCGSFYAILISSPKFKGLSTIKQHKLVNETLKEDIKSIHGLQLKTIPED